MQTGYTILAYSLQLNQTVRQFFLGDLKEPTLELLAEQAQLHADNFAVRLNQQNWLKTQDWVGQIELTQTGIETLDSFNGFEHGSNINTIDLARNNF